MGQEGTVFVEEPVSSLRSPQSHKGGAEVEFGRLMTLDEVEGGIVTRFEVLERPNEHGQAEAALAHHQKLFAHPPRILAGRLGRPFAYDAAYLGEGNGFDSRRGRSLAMVQTTGQSINAPCESREKCPGDGSLTGKACRTAPLLCFIGWALASGACTPTGSQTERGACSMRSLSLANISWWAEAAP
jgi:hypothetical protein